jgi:uncharacterized radical SAM protein YgiQ
MDIVRRDMIFAPSFIPATPEEMDRLGWNGLDVILVTGDAYIDSPFIGVAVIGRVLLSAGYRVGVIAQPDVSSERDICRLGPPALFWGVTSGSVDSMVANYTASGLRRKSDDMTPGGRNTKRPDRGIIVYSNLIRRYFKRTAPIVLGGIEASLRRISHYDAWSDSVRRSILFDAKADILVYGMAEGAVLELAEKIERKEDFRSVRGICYIGQEVPEPAAEFPGPDVELPAHDAVSLNKKPDEEPDMEGHKDRLIRMFDAFYANSDPFTAKRLYQRQDTRYLVHNPPAFPLSTEALDRIHELQYARDAHPLCRKQGRLTALDTIRFSLTTHRGCYGECRFCAITVHQGRHVVSRTEESILREAAAITRHPDFKGVIPDVGGPTANMYGFECRRKTTRGACAEKGCLFPEPCRHLRVDHGPQIRLLRALRRLEGGIRVFLASGIRYDLVLNDKNSGKLYLEEILQHHVSGQLKIAPEHIEDSVLHMMGKPGRDCLEAFLRLFRGIDRRNPKKVFLTYYLMAAHPGCTLENMQALRAYASETLHLLPEQVQIFTPTPSTYSTLAYCTGRDPFTEQPVYVERDPKRKQAQKEALKRKKRNDGFSRISPRTGRRAAPSLREQAQPPTGTLDPHGVRISRHAPLRRKRRRLQG